MSRVSYLQSIWQVCKVHKFHLSSTFPRCECGRRESAVLPDVYLTCHRWTRDTCPSQHNLDAKLESLSAGAWCLLSRCRLVSSDTTAIFTPNRDLTICRLAGPSPGLESWTRAEVTGGEINLDKIGNVQCAIISVYHHIYLSADHHIHHELNWNIMYLNIYLQYLHQCKIFTIRRQNHDWFPFYLIEKILIKSF